MKSPCMPSLNVDAQAPIVARLIATPDFHLNGGDDAFDASVAKVEPGVALDSSIAGFGALVLPSVAVTQSLKVTKRGAATAITTGSIDGVAEDIPVTYNGDASQSALLTQQFGIVGDRGLFSTEADSGALVCTQDNHPVGLIVGGLPTGQGASTPHSFASPILCILDFYQVSIKA